MNWRIASTLDGVDWTVAKADLAADDFDNGRSPEALKLSFEKSQYAVIAWAEGEPSGRCVGMARMLSDGVCNAYLLDVWTLTAYRRQGIGAAMFKMLVESVPGQHVGWQTDDAIAFYESLGARHQPEFMSTVSGSWLDNEANR